MCHASSLRGRERGFAGDTKTAARGERIQRWFCWKRMNQARYWVCQESVYEESHGIGAMRSCARSTPVWPPDMILRSISTNITSPLQLDLDNSFAGLPHFGLALPTRPTVPSNHRLQSFNLLAWISAWPSIGCPGAVQNRAQTQSACPNRA